MKIPHDIQWPAAVCTISYWTLHVILWLGFWALLFIYGCGSEVEKMKLNKQSELVLQEKK